MQMVYRAYNFQAQPSETGNRIHKRIHYPLHRHQGALGFRKGMINVMQFQQSSHALVVQTSYQQRALFFQLQIN